MSVQIELPDEIASDVKRCVRVLIDAFARAEKIEPGASKLARKRAEEATRNRFCMIYLLQRLEEKT